MPFRVSFFYQLREGTKLGGWSVNLYNSAADQSTAIAKTNAMRELLYNLTANTVSLFAARVQDLGHFRAAELIPYTYSNLPSNQTVWDADQFNVSALVKVQDAGTNITRFWIRGNPDDAVSGGGLWRPGGNLLTAWNRFFAALKDASNLWVQRKLISTAPKTFVQQITMAGVVTSVGHGLAAGNLTRIGRVQFPKTLNKVWRVASKIDNDNFTLTGPPTMTASAIVGASTYSQIQTYGFPVIASAIVDRVSSHKTGRPFGLLSGRRRVVRA